MPATAHRIDALVRERPGISRGELCRAIGTDVDSALRRLVQVGYIRRTVRRATPVLSDRRTDGRRHPSQLKGPHHTPATSATASLWHSCHCRNMIIAQRFGQGRLSEAKRKVAAPSPAEKAARGETGGSLFGG
jgi:hypothetical protein